MLASLPSVLLAAANAVVVFGSSGGTSCGGLLVHTGLTGAHIITARHCVAGERPRFVGPLKVPRAWTEVKRGDGALLLKGDSAIVRILGLQAIPDLEVPIERGTVLVAVKSGLQFAVIRRTRDDRCDSLIEGLTVSLRDRAPDFSFHLPECAEINPGLDLNPGESGSPILLGSWLLGTLSGDDGRGLIVYERAELALDALEACKGIKDWTPGCSVRETPYFFRPWSVGSRRDPPVRPSRPAPRYPFFPLGPGGRDP